MATVDAWTDFEPLRQSVKHNTVDRLKHIVNGLNEECRANLFKSGKKQDLIDRVVAQLVQWRQANDVEMWTRAKAVFHLVKNSGTYAPNRIPSNRTISAAASYAPLSLSNVLNPAAPQTSDPTVRYDIYAQQRKHNIPSTSLNPHSVPKMATGIRFKPSPFLRVDHTVSNVVECPESTGSSDRRQQHLTFTLNQDDINKLKSTSPKYQLRLYCTSTTFYSTGPNSFRTNVGPCPIEFPPTCEVRVNGIQLTANLKGLKKKPGTAPPPDLGKTLRLAAGSANRVEMVYVNSQQPPQPKGYFLVVALTEVTSVDQLVDTLRKGKYRSTQEILTDLVKPENPDDDVVAGSQKVSLRCPLSFLRIKTPCRSLRCVHPQCFDAMSWFAVMEQTTTWLCPVCEKVLEYEDLIMDGYFDQILGETSEDIDDVIVEASGQWHTIDNKYASEEWRLSHPLPPNSSPQSQRSLSSPKDHTKSPLEDEARERRGGEILILDSDDDEDEGRVKRELSPSLASIGQSSGYLRTRLVPDDTVIDLTLDSDDDSPPPPSQTSSQKRKEMVVETHHRSSSKRPRADDNTSLMRAIAMRTVNNSTSSSSNQITPARDHVPSFSQQLAALPQRFVGPHSRFARPAPHLSYPTTQPPAPRGNARLPGVSSSTLQNRAWN